MPILLACLICQQLGVRKKGTLEIRRHQMDRSYASPGQRATRVTRRSWIRRITAHLIAMTTFLKAPMPVSAQSCTEWFRCNQQGCLCSCRGGSDSSCPPGTSSGTKSWYACCYDPVRNRAFIVRSIDCCQSSQPSPCPSSCLCSRGQPQPNWCGDSRSVVCTRAVLVGVC